MNMGSTSFLKLEPIPEYFDSYRIIFRYYNLLHKLFH